MVGRFQFMIDCRLSSGASADFWHWLPAQLDKVTHFLEVGKLVNYALSEDRQRLWAIVNADNEMEVWELLHHFPPLRRLDIQISLLSAFDQQNAPIPHFSLN